MSTPSVDPGAGMDRNVASFAIDLVVELGVGTAFSLTGGMAMYLNNAAAAHPGLRVVFCQHEQACAAAAEGFSEAMDFRIPGLAIVTAGPGVTNAVTGLCSAFGDSAPVIVLAGQVKTADIDRLGCRTYGAQEVRSQEIVSPCVKRFLRLDRDSWREGLIHTFVEALTGRPGPVFIEIPLDVQNHVIRYGPAEVDEAVRIIRQRVAEDRKSGPLELLAGSIDWLMEGDRPLVYVGNGCRVAGVEGAVRRLIETRGLPFVCSWLAADQLSADHPLNFGAPGGLAPIAANKVLYAADRTLFLGARLDLGTTAFQRDQFGAQAERVVVDVDPAELSKFAGLTGTRVIEAHLALLPDAIDRARSQARAATTWVTTCEVLRDELSADEEARLDTPALNVYTTARQLSDWSTDKIIVPTGSGAAIETFIRFFRPKAGARLFFGASLGAMGLGLPLALGAAFATDRRVICVEGDGGLMLNLQELATLSHYAPKGFVLFILNNNGYQSIMISQQRHFGLVSGADLDSGVFIPDYGKLVPAFGLDYQRIESLSALEALLPTLSPEATPTVVDLVIEPNEPRGPGARTVIGADGKITSTSLAELSW